MTPVDIERPPLVPEAVNRLRHPDGGVIDVYMPMDAIRFGEVLMALGAVGWELHRTDNLYTGIDRKPPEDLRSAPGGPKAEYSTSGATTHRVRLADEPTAVLRYLAEEGTTVHRGQVTEGTGLKRSDVDSALSLLVQMDLVAVGDSPTGDWTLGYCITTEGERVWQTARPTPNAVDLAVLEQLSRSDRGHGELSAILGSDHDFDSIDRSLHELCDGGFVTMGDPAELHPAYRITAKGSAILAEDP